MPGPEQAPITPDEARVQSADDFEVYKENYKIRVNNENVLDQMGLISHPAYERSVKSEKVQLWDAHQAYQGNKEAYQQAALEDAARAGVETSFGNQHYPAQTPEQPKV